MPGEKTVQARLNDPQGRFLALPHKFRAYVAGFGSGKTWVGCTAIAKHIWENPKVAQGYFAPTFPLIRDIFYPTMEEVAESMGLHVRIHQANKEVHIYAGRQYRGTVICRSMDAPETIVGFKIGNALIDELDLLKPEKAAAAWRKIIARMRHTGDGVRNGISVTTTPEGFRFVYEQFRKLPSEKPELADLYGLVQASTYDNESNLPDDYISSLKASYPQQLIDAYLNGQFVNLNSGAVYPDFCRAENHSAAELAPGEAIHVGADFNVYNCTGIIAVIRDGRPVVVDELTGVRDTPALARMLKERYRDKGHQVTAYPDASGQAHKSVNASLSDLQIIKDHGISLIVNSTNPAVKDRVAAVNAAILNGAGKRSLTVNTRRCPVLTECLEQQVYDKNGEPDKDAGKDHGPDALGYFITALWPVVKPVAAGRTNVPHMAR